MNRRTVSLDKQTNVHSVLLLMDKISEPSQQHTNLIKEVNRRKQPATSCSVEEATLIHILMYTMDVMQATRTRICEYAI